MYEGMTSKELKLKLSLCYEVYNKYLWLLDSYVLDFFTDKHWSKLATSWQQSLNDLDPNHIAELLDINNNLNSYKNNVWPLSLISLRIVLKQLCLPRQQQDLQETDVKLFDEKLLKLFWKNVKAKKRHEIAVISDICRKSTCKTDCIYVVDVGSGLGHLSRMLNYQCNLTVCAIEAQNKLSKQAEQLDQVFQHQLYRYAPDKINNRKITYVNHRIDINIESKQFLKLVKTAFGINENDTKFRFGLIGLHPCGDLGATLLRIFNECQNAVFINIVGCCYMKLSPTVGFPLSNFSRKNSYSLSYSSCEVACHAIETYIDKLQQGEHWKLKIHCYRAAIESIIVEINSQLRHSPLSNMKYTDDLSFETYCHKAVVKLGINLPSELVTNSIINNYLDNWKKVVVFYSLRLFFAPLIETIILIDRILFIQEAGIDDCSIDPVFNPKISPRNQVLTAFKSNK